MSARKHRSPWTCQARARDAETASPPQSNSMIRLMAMSATVLNLDKRLYSSFQIIVQTSAALC